MQHYDGDDFPEPHMTQNQANERQGRGPLPKRAPRVPRDRQATHGAGLLLVALYAALAGFLSAFWMWNR